MGCSGHRDLESRFKVLDVCGFDEASTRIVRVRQKIATRQGRRRQSAHPTPREYERIPDLGRAQKVRYGMVHVVLNSYLQMGIPVIRSAICWVSQFTVSALTSVTVPA